MNNKPETDPIELLRQSAKPRRAPKLSEDLLEQASTGKGKSSTHERLRLAAPVNRFGAIAGAAMAAVVALSLGAGLQPHSNIHISLGSSSGLHSAKLSDGFSIME